MIDDNPMAKMSALSDAGPPAFTVTSDGKQIPAPFGNTIASVAVTLNANLPGSFTLEINDPRLLSIDPATGPFQEGMPIEIAFGYGRARSSIFNGSITAIAAELTASRGMSLQVQGFDALHRATRGGNYPDFVDGESDSAIVARIAQDVLKLQASVAIDGSRNRQRVRENLLALEFLQSLATEYGCMFWVADGTFNFRSAPAGLRVPLYRGANLVSFSVRLSTAGQVSEVQTAAYDTAQKKEIVASARLASYPGYGAKLSASGTAQVSGGGSGTKQVLHADVSATTPDEAQHYADAALRHLRRSLITAEGSALGDPAIRVGSVLVVTDFGRFSGEYVVESARHQINEQGYLTSFDARQYL